MAPGMTDPKSWGQAISEIGIPGTTIIALLAILAYLAFKGVPAVVDLTLAINNSTAAAEKRQTSLEAGQANIVTNQGTIIGNETLMIAQHTELLKTNRAMQALEAQTCINTAKSAYQTNKCTNIHRDDDP